MIAPHRFCLLLASSVVVALLACRGDEIPSASAHELERAIDTPSREVRIMPLGDSITYENHQRDKRPTEERIAYRHRLWELLRQDGRRFDFVGNRNAGLNYFTDPDDADNAGFPGIKTEELADLVETGGGGKNWQDQAPGPYFDSYPADIVLLHIGTNGLAPGNWTHVERILDTIDRWEAAPGNNPVTTIVARIIGRWPHSPETTEFNDNVESMVLRRHAAGDRVLLVDIERGAGIDYMLEMDDRLHPRRSGYAKMAEQWYPAITAVLDGRPYVAVRDPLPGASCEAGTRITIKADAFFPGGTVERVEFFVNGAGIGTDDTAPYSVEWTVAPGRGHTLEAMAIHGGSLRSASRPVVINPWRILALGDGITQGEHGRDSYRYGLWRKLVDARVPFRFVGSRALLRGEVLGYWSDERQNQIRHEYAPYAGRWFDQDRFHEGHWGWRADELLNGRPSEEGAGPLSERLQGCTADVALVHVGTADAMQGEDATSTVADIEGIIARLRADNPGIAVLLAKLLPATDEPHNRAIAAINARIDGVAAALSTPESPIVVVDAARGFDPVRDTHDGIHPNASGEAKLAEAWFGPLAAALGEHAGWPAPVAVELPLVSVEDRKALPAPESWSYARIEGFEVLSSASRKESVRVLNDFQVFREALAVVKPSSALDSPVSIILCGRDGGFAAFSADGRQDFNGVVSFMLRDRERAALVINLMTRQLEHEDISMIKPAGGYYGSMRVEHERLLYREYVRLLHSPVDFPRPAWFVEGLAQIATDMQFTKSTIKFGLVDLGTGAPVFSGAVEYPEMEAGSMIGMMGAGPAAVYDPTAEVGDRPFNPVLLRQALIPWDRFFAVTSDAPEARNPLGDARWAKQAYAFVHMCQFGADQRFKEPLERFVGRLTFEAPSETLFRECFGVTYPQMRKELGDYISRGRYVYRNIRLAKGSELTAKPVEFRDATQGEIARIKGDAQRLAGRRAEALMAYRVAHARGETDPALLGALGVAEAEAGSTERARQFLEVATKLGTDRPTAWIALARLRLAAAETDSVAGNGLAAAQMRFLLEPLLRARALKPAHPDTYHLMAEVWQRSVIVPTPAQVHIVGEGAMMFPSDADLSLRVANLYVRAGDAGNAGEVARMGLRFARDAVTRQRFERFLRTLSRD